MIITLLIVLPLLFFVTFVMTIACIEDVIRKKDIEKGVVFFLVLLSIMWTLIILLPLNHFKLLWDKIKKISADGPHHLQHNNLLGPINHNI